MTRKDFYKWMNKCSCDHQWEQDSYGEINITFYPEESKEGVLSFGDWKKMQYYVDIKA
jgi:hypothetical protein